MRAGTIEDGKLLAAAAFTIRAREEAPKRPVLAGDLNRLLHALSERLLERRHVRFVHHLEIEQDRPHLVERLLAEHARGAAD